MAVRTTRLPNGMYIEDDNVEANLRASSAPIKVEPMARPRRNMRQEQIDRLVAAGDDPATAARVVDSMAEGAVGEIDPALFDSYNTPQGNEALRGRIADGRRANARQDAFEANYNAATGHPEYGYDEAGNPARVGRVDIGNMSEADLLGRGARRYQARAPYNAEIEAANHGPGSDYAPSAEKPSYADMTVPGPRTLDGKSPTPSRGLTAQEAEAYNTRPEKGLSQRDRDMMARGYVPVVTADGVSYRPGYVSESNKYAIPGGPGRPGPRPELAGKYEMDVAVGPDGVERDVLVPTAKFRAGQDEVLDARRKRLADERKEARQRWQATAYLAGGSQNLNSGNRWIANALVDMDPEDRERSMRYMLPGGQLQAQVDAQNAEKAAEMARAAVAGSLRGAIPDPIKDAALEQQRLSRQQDAVRWAEDNINARYAYDAGSLFGTDFTVAEQQQAVDDLVLQFGMSQAEAQKIVDNIATRKPRPRPAGQAPEGSFGPGGLPVAPGSTPYRTGA